MEAAFDFSEKLMTKLSKYCELNGLNINEYVENSVNKSLMVDMYGNTPFSTRESFYELPKEDSGITESASTVYIEPEREEVATTTTTKKPRVKRVSTTTTTIVPLVEEVTKPIVVSRPPEPVRRKRRL